MNEDSSLIIAFIFSQAMSYYSNPTKLMLLCLCSVYSCFQKVLVASLGFLVTTEIKYFLG